MGKYRVSTWRALYPDKYDLDAFQELFMEELESWFSADIVCCDACYDDYASVWPGITSSGAFQSKGIPLDCFYSGSHLCEVYTEKEFSSLCERMGCPVCSAPLTANIWAYNPPFDIPPEFESDIAELGIVAKRTPFLVLKHPLARKVRKEIGRIAAAISPTMADAVLFRARPKEVEKIASQFLAPPPAKCPEGRYNHSGRPALYLANDPSVAQKEIAEKGAAVVVARVRLRSAMRVMDFGDDLLSNDVLRAVTVSSLLSAPSKKSGWEKPEYNFTRFVADCALDAGLEAIKYPSVANANGFNLVLLPSEKNYADMVDIEGIVDFTS